LNQVSQALTDVCSSVKPLTLIKGLRKQRQTKIGICGKALAKNINYRVYQCPYVGFQVRSELEVLGPK
jgi:hypothetical protein